MRLYSDEKYVLDLIAEVLNEDYHWQKKFDTLLGDPGKNGRRTKLPVDAYFPESNLIVEYREKQHLQPVAIMDKRMTVSGVHRGEQRRLYDLRKEAWAEGHKIRFMVVAYNDLAHKKNGLLKRDPNYDRAAIKILIDKIMF